MKQLLVLLLLSVSMCGFAGENERNATVSVQALPGSVAAGFHIAFKGRKLCEQEMNTPGFADLTGYILEQNYRKMQQEFDKLGCELQFYDYPFLPFDDYYTRDEMSFIRGKVPNGKVAEALSLVSQLIQSAETVNGKELAQAVRSCTRGNRMRRSLNAVAGQHLRQLLFENEYPAYPTYFKGKIPDLMRVKKFMRRYYSPGNMTITVVGDVNAASLKKEIEGRFTASKAGAPCGAKFRVKMTIPEKRTASYETSRKSQGQLLLVRPLKENLNESELAAALLFAREFSDLISFQLREREGLAYSIGAGIRSIGGRYFLAVSMGTSPKFVKSSADRISKMLETLLKEPGVSETELERIRNSLLISRRMKRLTNVNKAFFYGVNLLWHRPLNFEEQVDKSIEKVDIGTLANAKALFSGPEIRMLINATEGQLEKDNGEKREHRKHL